MLKIGKLTDYAMLILGQMAKTPDAILSAAVLAEKLYLTTPTVSKVLKMLSESQLVTSVRGAEGGYRLARIATTITVADVIAAMEGGLAMTACCESKGVCAIDTMCTMRGNWKKINNMVQSLLASVSIMEMTIPLADNNR
jgi:FeS assembly SUF system regulator